MDTTQRELIMQRGHVVQCKLMPELRIEVGTLIGKLSKIIHTLEWVAHCKHLGSALIGHISRDGTATAARERPARKEKSVTVAPVAKATRG
jgi:hypothetical protein